MKQIRSIIYLTDFGDQCHRLFAILLDQLPGPIDHREINQGSRIVRRTEKH